MRGAGSLAVFFRHYFMEKKERMPDIIRTRIAKIYAECTGVWAQYDVTDWERQRLEEWKNRDWLTPKQLGVLEQIEKKVFGEE